MKTKVFLFGLLFALASQLNAQGIFDKLASEKEVTVVRITKSVLEMMPDVDGKADINGVEIGALKDKLDLLEIFTTEKPEMIAIMRQGIKEYEKTPSLFEEIMTVKDEDTEVRFFVGKENKKDKNIKSLIMFVDNGDEGVMMRLLGDFAMQDFKGIIDSSM